MRVGWPALFLTLLLSRAAAAHTHYYIDPVETSRFGYLPGRIGDEPFLAAVKAPILEYGVAPYEVYVPANPAASRGLLVFLPDAGQTPLDYRRLLAAAADLGYHAIGLSYPDVAGVASCPTQRTSLRCFADLREEVWTGTAQSSLATVDRHPQDSIKNRLTAVLGYLASKKGSHAAEGWSAFLEDGGPRWPTITLAGHDAGAAYVALIAGRRSVAGVLLFGGLADGSGDADGATDPKLYFGFAQAAVVQRIDQLERSWSQVKLPGRCVVVDGVRDYGGSHRLLTAHEGVAVDGVYLPVWRYMLGGRLGEKLVSRNPQPGSPASPR